MICKNCKKEIPDNSLCTYNKKHFDYNDIEGFNFLCKFF